ncbi:MAG: SCO family protein, partial [Flavobacteriales bacterium]|nr:SCO family protein [Flavobacteriales bacterium]
MKKLIPVGIILVIGIAVAYFMIKDNKPKLKVFNPIDINPELVDESVRNVDKFHRVGSFSLTDQDGNEVTEKNFEDKIYVTDFFFVTCPT